MTTETTDSPTLKRGLLCFGVALGLVALDLWSKSAAFAFLDTANLEVTSRGHHRYPVLGDWLGMMKNLNWGAAFGQGADFQWVLIPMRAAAVAGVSWLILRAPVGQVCYLSALVLILAGAAGNLYDNLFNGDLFVEGQPPFGPVRDFIDVYFGIWEWHFPTFNVADSCITVGAVLLLFSGREGSGGADEGPLDPQG